MFIKTLEIKNFRSIENTIITFNKNLNILIGPNNSGKTTIIDALRICLTYKDYNSLRIKKEDFHMKKENLLEDIEFNLTFTIEKNIEKAIFSELYSLKNNLENDFLFITYIFSYDEKLNKIRSKVFGGINKDNPIPDEIFDYLLNFYLSALRDANRYLTPGKNNILSSFFSDLKSNKDKSDLIDEINENIKKSELSQFINKSTEKYIQKCFNEITFSYDNTKIHMSPIDQEFDSFTKNWKIRLPLNQKQANFLEIPQNGLGYNNLIYISVLISKLNYIKENNEENYYISLSIEEPEAHLQPQLQNLFFSYLNTLNQKSSIQIFVTSHSPTLTAKADLNSLILIETTENNVKTMKLNECFSNKEDLNYLRKFLDVTKSQLLFSKKIIFVEGISEAILIPIFAKKCGFDLDKNGVEVVNVQGINFKHFIPLFNKNNNLNIKGVILTDDDRKSINGNPSDSCNKIKNMCEGKFLKVYASKKTFEYDLICSNGFNSLVYNIFTEKHHDIFEKITNEEELFNLFNNKNNVKKADIALNLSYELKNKKYTIPQYIKDSFKYLMENNHEL